MLLRGFYERNILQFQMYTELHSVYITLDSNIMRIKYQLKFRDNLIFIVFHQLLSIPIQLFCGGMALFTIFSSLGVRSVFIGAIMALLAYMAVWAIQLIFIIFYLCFGSYRSLLTNHIVEIHEDAFFDETKFSRSYHFWPGVTKVVNRIGYVAVYINANAAQIIPSRAFASPAQREEFVSIVRAKVRAA